MLIIRPVAQHDLDDLMQLAHKAGAGMTSLPACATSLNHKIQQSINSFVEGPGQHNDDFLLVMEDSNKAKIVGTAAVHARTGSRQAFYAYRIMSANHFAHSLNQEVRNEVLHLSNDYSDCSEIGTLFIDPAYKGNGHWLGQARYLLMAQFKHRFADNVIAQLRGVVDEQGQSPFWNDIGRHFFPMSFAEADALCGTNSNQFITELMPKHPIYTCLLSEAARAAIGTAHRAGNRAQQLLLAEGFQFENVIDIFDGGPMLRAPLSQINSIKHIQLRQANDDELSINTKNQVIANTSLSNFRVIKQNTTGHWREALQVDATDAVALIAS